MDWNRLHNIHSGQTCLVIGNGPSLKNVSQAFLASYPSFGSNRCYLPGGYIPDYYVVVNNLLIEQFHKEIAGIDCKLKFVKTPYAHLIPGAIPLKSIPQHVFSEDPSKGIYEGYTVTYAAMQLAYWMGFTTVLLVGCDHNYKQDGKPNQMRKLEGDDPNHFSADYFKGAFWNLADIDRMNEAYGMARKAFEKDGRKIINLTPGSRLDIFEKGEIKQWMKQA